MSYVFTLLYVSWFCFCFCFFFFKQKTAYEMRISDWSSDVCSSDLDVRGAVLPEHPHRQPAVEADERAAEDDHGPAVRPPGWPLGPHGRRRRLEGDRKSVV